MTRTRHPHPFLIAMLVAGCFDTGGQAPVDVDTDSTGSSTGTTGTSDTDEGTTAAPSADTSTSPSPGGTAGGDMSECDPGVFDDAVFGAACFQ